MQDRKLIFGVVALTAVATAGWMRQPKAVTIPYSSFTAPAGTALDPAYATAPIAATQVSAAVVPVHSGVYRQTGTPVARPYPRYSEPVERRRSVETTRDVDYRPEPVVRKRSTAKSAAIIAGSAAAGAAIGGLAGGGKGAAIGALGGGAAGLVYDRMTKNR